MSDWLRPGPNDASGKRSRPISSTVTARYAVQARSVTLTIEFRRHGHSAMAPPFRASSVAPAGPSARATPPRRSPESFTPRVRLHLKPGQKGTKQLLAAAR
jgi:hypothetical protein